LPLAQTLERMGVVKIIVGFARVGSECGANLAIVREVLEETNLQVLTGGGIRGINDLEVLRNVGVSGALIATILHTGKLTAKRIEINWFYMRFATQPHNHPLAPYSAVK
jgi:uncharacterized protein related to proFAR isomerase